MCDTPITLKRTYRTISGEFTNVVPCGKCLSCLRRRQGAWSFRLSEQMKVSHSSAFLTLTYTDLSMPYSESGRPTLKKDDFQRFMKRLRKALPVKMVENKDGEQYNLYQLKYYACGEYGSRTMRPHYHCIMFNLPQAYIQDPQRLEAHWSLGYLRLDPCNSATINYTTKYIMKGSWKKDDMVNIETGEITEDDRVPEFSLMSKKLGKEYLTPAMRRYYKQNIVNYVTLPGGVKVSLPRYYREQIFGITERKIIAMESKKVRESLLEQRFHDEYHKVEYVRDLERRMEKQQQLTRNKI